MENEENYDLDRKSAEISALPSNNLDKYEYLTGAGLDLQPSFVEQTRFKYSPLGKFFNKGLKKGDKQEGLKNIEDKNEEQLNAIKDKKNHSVAKLTTLNLVYRSTFDYILIMSILTSLDLV